MPITTTDTISSTSEKPALFSIRPFIIVIVKSPT